MTHQVDMESQVLKQIRDLPVADQYRVLDRIKALAEEPRPNGCEKLAGMRDAWRIRSGNYRIVYRVDDAAEVVTVTRVGYRREVYRRK
jgi:mRNA interferase RelE/StbE